MLSYHAYGLHIDSIFELPELSPAPAHAAADITFRKHRVEPQKPRDARTGPAIAASSREISISYPGIVSLLITDGELVDVDAQPKIDPAILRLILLGPILALVLHQRGYLVLHASAVELNSTAVAFIGDKGAGKSTTAAAFNAEGYALFSDDVVAVAPESHLVYPRLPSTKTLARSRPTPRR